MSPVCKRICQHAAHQQLHVRTPPHSAAQEYQEMLPQQWCSTEAVEAKSGALFCSRTCSDITARARGVLPRACRLPPQDVVLDNGELLESEYIVAPSAAILLEAAPRAPPPSRQTQTAVRQASQVYQRMGQL